MWIPLLLSFVLALPTGTATGSIQGRIVPPENMKITKPVQVVVFSGKYVNLYLAELQKRIDNYWEDYKGAFIMDKQAFVLFRDQAQRQSMDLTLNRMRLDDPGRAAGFVHTTTNNNFEFRNVPQGECKLVALVPVGNQEFIWSASVILTDELPAIVTLKPTNP